MNKCQGTLRWFDSESGYGLVCPDDGGRRLFVHRQKQAAGSDLETFEEGSQVTYEITQGKKGMRATKVAKVSR